MAAAAAKNSTLIFGFKIGWYCRVTWNKMREDISYYYLLLHKERIQKSDFLLAIIQ